LGTSAALVLDFTDVVLVIDLVFVKGTRGRKSELYDDFCDDSGVVI